MRWAYITSPLIRTFPVMKAWIPFISPAMNRTKLGSVKLSVAFGASAGPPLA